MADLHGESGGGWIGVDLDGTLAEYHGWKGVENIGKPVPKMVERVKNWLASGKQVKIMTARGSGGDSQNALPHIQKWLADVFGEDGEKIPVVHQKDFKMIELWDDRCIQVIPNTGERADGKD